MEVLAYMLHDLVEWEDPLALCVGAADKTVLTPAFVVCEPRFFLLMRAAGRRVDAGPGKVVQELKLFSETGVSVAM